jgi:hypothetical protein
MKGMRGSPAIPKRPAGDRQAPVSADQLCLLINFGRPKVEIRRVTAETWSREPSPSSPLIPLIRLKKEKLPLRTGIVPPIHIRSTIPAISLCKAQQPFRFRP